MKIITDVNYSGIQKSNIKSFHSSTELNNKTVTNSISQQNTSTHQREKAIVDALIIAQSSRELLQKAIIISSKLKSIASDTLLSGHVDIDELNNQISGIQDSIIHYGEKLEIPVTELDNSSNNNLNLSIKKDIDDLAHQANNIFTDKSVTLKDIDQITDHFKLYLKDYEKQIREYPFISDHSNLINYSEINYHLLNNDTVDYIKKYPEKSLLIQGNVTHHNASTYMKT